MEIKSKCHCCLQRLSARDLRTPFTHLGITESYSDMVAECFAINLFLDINAECGICLECVNQLREACHFKLQVLESQAKLRECWGWEQQAIEEETDDAMMCADDKFSSSEAPLVPPNIDGSCEQPLLSEELDIQQDYVDDGDEKPDIQPEHVDGDPGGNSGSAHVLSKSVSTVRRIVLEGDLNNAVFSTPGKHRKGRPKKELDDFDLCAIRQKVKFCYTVKKEVPTLRSLLRIVKEDLDFTGSREHLRKVLQALGFRYKKCQSERTALMAKTHIADKRESYLKIIMENKMLPEELRKEVVYLDESYVHSSYKLKTKLAMALNIAGVRENVSKGKRYIIVHAGRQKGLIPNALLIFSGKNKNEDYHSEMNSTNFTKWVKEKLIPNLPNESIVVMDNAPYHSVIRNKAPTSNNNVGHIKQWLTQNNIPFDPTLRKPGLVMLLRKHKPKPIYEIYEILGEHGHTRTYMGHCIT